MKGVEARTSGTSVRDMARIIATMGIVVGCAPVAKGPTSHVDASAPAEAASSKVAGSAVRIRACSVDTVRGGTIETNEYTIAVDVAGRGVELRATSEHPAPDPDSAPSRSLQTITRSYDPAGRIVEETRRSTSHLEDGEHVVEQKTTWSRDVHARISRVEHGASRFTGSTLTSRELVLVTVVERDPAERPTRVDRLTRIQLWDGRGRPAAEERVRRDEPFRERAYDEDGRVIVERWTDDGGVERAKRSLTRRFRYEKKRVTQDLVVQEGARWTEQQTVTTYDERGRRVRVERFGPDRQPNHGEQLEYDDAGHLVARTMADERGRSTFRRRGDCPTNLDDLFEQRLDDTEHPWWEELEPSALIPR